MKKILMILVSVLVISTLAPALFPTVGKEAVAVTKKTGAKKLRQITGMVTSINTAAKSIIVGGLTIMVDDEEMLADVKVGDMVEVTYIVKGRNLAISIIHK